MTPQERIQQLFEWHSDTYIDSMGNRVKCVDKESFVAAMTEYSEEKDKELAYLRRDLLEQIKQSSLLQSENERLKAVITELVYLKDMKDKFGFGNQYIGGMLSGIQEDYLKRKPLAWQAARESLAQSSIKPKGE